jgi:hypothetical protein
LHAHDPIAAGTDGSGFLYWWFDWSEAATTRIKPASSHLLAWEGGGSTASVDYGHVLFREPPLSLQASKLSQGRSGGGSTLDAGPAGQPSVGSSCDGGGRWEVAGTALAELEAVGAKLARSLRPADKTVAATITQGIVTALRERVQDAERWRKAQERTRRTLGLDAGLLLDRHGCCRPFQYIVSVQCLISLG